MTCTPSTNPFHSYYLVLGDLYFDIVLENRLLREAAVVGLQQLYFHLDQWQGGHPNQSPGLQAAVLNKHPLEHDCMVI